MPERFAGLSNRLSVSNDWQRTTATIVSSTHRYAKLWELPGDSSCYLIEFSYKVNGEQFVGRYKRHDSLIPGHKIEILYNPSRPDQNHLSGDESSPALRWVIRLITAIIAGSVLYLLIHFDVPTRYRPF